MVDAVYAIRNASPPLQWLKHDLLKCHYSVLSMIRLSCCCRTSCSTSFIQRLIRVVVELSSIAFVVFCACWNPERLRHRWHEITRGWLQTSTHRSYIEPGRYYRSMNDNPCKGTKHAPALKSVKWPAEKSPYNNSSTRIWNSVYYNGSYLSYLSNTTNIPPLHYIRPYEYPPCAAHNKARSRMIHCNTIIYSVSISKIDFKSAYKNSNSSIKIVRSCSHTRNHRLENQYQICKHSKLSSWKRKSKTQIIATRRLCCKHIIQLSKSIAR